MILRIIFRFLLGLGAIVVCTAPSQATGADACEDVPQDAKARVVQYVHRRYSVRTDGPFRISSIETLPGTCHKRVTLDGHSPDGDGMATLVVYLTSDNLYVAKELFDTRLDPVEEAARERATQWKEVLEAGAPPSEGPIDAPVVIVLFSDFQCPACRETAVQMDRLRSEYPRHLRLIYRHFPLPYHSWAMTAAETAACVSLQKPSAFWALHGAIFEKQDVITPASIGEVSGAMAGQTGGIDKSALDSCVDSGQGRTIVQTDMRLGASVGIRATPTAFINGIRVEGVPSDVQVQTMIRESSGAPSTGP